MKAAWVDRVTYHENEEGVGKMLKIKNLEVSIKEGKKIIQNLDLNVKPGETHTIMGPNGSGKSTLSNVIAGHSDYIVDGGEIEFLGEDLLALAPEERAIKGVFLSFQYPVGLPGVSTISFLQAVVNEQRKKRSEPLVEAIDLIQMAEEACKMVGLPKSFLHRPLNKGFSGGEKKRAELIQLILLQPKIVILDETDSGLDIDALRVVGNVITEMQNSNRGIVIVTHYNRLLEHVKTDYVHVMSTGKIVKSGDASLAKQLEKEGYSWVENGK